MPNLRYNAVHQLLQEKYPKCYEYGLFTDPDGEEVWLASDWNDVPSCIIHHLEKNGVIVGYSEEYLTDGEGQCFREDEPHTYFICNGEVCDAKSAKEDPEWYVDWYELVNNPERADQIGIDFSQLGFSKGETTYQNGWYGVEDRPEKLIEKFTCDVIFQIKYVNPFETGYIVWTRANVDFETFFNAYLEAAVGEVGRYTKDDIYPESFAEQRKECWDFFQQNHWSIWDDQYKKAGHDFWLTRNEHGAGFWPDHTAERLTKASEKFGTVGLTIHENQIYMETVQ